MVVDYLIVGQGVCGTLLSWFLHEEGKSFRVIDDQKKNAASKIAAGIISPVTGRRYAYTWMIDEIMPFALVTYEKMGLYLNESFIFKKSIIDFFPSAQMRNAFIDRLHENDTYLHPYPEQNNFNPYFNYEFGCGQVDPAYIVHLPLLLSSWKKKLQAWQWMEEQTFDRNELKIRGEKIFYQHLEADKIIFCDGIAGIDNPWFGVLPYALNKGEALIIECPEFPHHHIFKKGLLLAPMSEPHHFWVGSNYQWHFKDDQPSENFYNYANTILKSWIKSPYKIIAHYAGIRPATLERRPFVGVHPGMPQLALLNGMGTKGASLAPFFAYQLSQSLIHHFTITPEADVKRYTRLLTK
ncbi:MAG: FAD-dependent oxidoreductase [Flavisolibacter sp.]